MTNNQISPIGVKSPFEEIKKINKNGKEYWSARKLMLILGYSKWDNFKNVIEKAMDACENSNFETSEPVYSLKIYKFLK